jgi:NAD(P)-dependent dehydrogenase (short-subunit alcohol dehydrogenase family)
VRVEGHVLLWAGLHRKRPTLRVLVLGGTGPIGSAVVRELVGRGHQLFALARSAASAARLDQIGVTAIAGDIGSPEAWVATLRPLDAVIHMACDFNTDMGAVDRRLLDALLPALAANKQRPRFLYTGGCWLFGATGDDLATEQTPFRPLPAPRTRLDAAASRSGGRDPLRRSTAGPGHKITKTTPCKVEWAPAFRSPRPARGERSDRPRDPGEGGYRSND